MPDGVVFDSVSKLFGEVHAVRDLSLRAEEGEFLVLVGPSGCGKTTALRMIAGLEEPSAGEISIAGKRVNGVQPRDRDIAMVFQNYALYPHMNVYDNMAFGLKQRKTPRSEIRERVEAAAGMLGLEALLERKPKELSGGQRQRVALGRAIVRRPKVFLMDEPLSNLDAHLRLRTRADIAGLHRKLQTTFVYVTHDQVEAMTMGSRIAVMKDGILQQLDTPQRLYDAPVNSFVATFIGSPSMNLIEGEVGRSTGGLAFKSPTVAVPLGPWSEAELPVRVTLGIRPEHLRLCARDGEPGALTGEVTLVEPLGSDMFVTVETSTDFIVARLPPATDVREGEQLSLRIDSRQVHLFATESGLRCDGRRARDPSQPEALPEPV